MTRTQRRLLKRADGASAPFVLSGPEALEAARLVSYGFVDGKIARGSRGEVVSVAVLGIAPGGRNALDAWRRFVRDIAIGLVTAAATALFMRWFGGDHAATPEGFAPRENGIKRLFERDGAHNLAEPLDLCVLPPFDVSEPEFVENELGEQKGGENGESRGVGVHCAFSSTVAQQVKQQLTNTNEIQLSELPNRN